MVKAKHTPGPWTVEDPMGLDTLSIIARGDRPTYEWRHVALITAKPDDADDIPAREAKANANLIAAAPDMLAALQRAIWFDHPSEMEEPGGLFHDIRAAIAKATGGRP